MKRSLLISFCMALNLAYAQNPVAGLQDWLGNLVNTEEHLLHREAVGPYIVSADGQRLLHHPYLKLDVRHEGKPVPEDTSIRIETTLFHNGPEIRKTYTPTYDGRHFIIDPLDLSAAEDWTWDEGGWLRMNVMIDGPLGKGESVMGIEVYPPKPGVSNVFRIVNIAVPLVVVALFAAIYRLRHVKLQRQPVT